MKRYTRVLTVAGSDSGGGAGIQADLKTFSALGCFGMSAITAITAQNTVAVTHIHPVPVDVIGAQIDAVISDLGVDAVKIGMLHSPETIEMVAERLSHHEIAQVVLDPVMVAKSGDTLLEDRAIAALSRTLIPIARMITPNLPEASVLLNRPVITVEDMDAACRDLLDFGSEAVLLKGGHLPGEEMRDLLMSRDMDAPLCITGRRIDTPNSHGTGCTLSAAIAAHLAKGMGLAAAVSAASDYLKAALVSGAGYRIGDGHGPVHHFHAAWS